MTYSATFQAPYHHIISNHYGIYINDVGFKMILNTSYISEFHLFHVVYGVHGQGSLVDEGVQAGVGLHQQLLC